MLRILRFNNKSTAEIQIQFTENLDTEIGINNVFVKSSATNIPDLAVKSVEITKSVISIMTNPQIPLALYYVQFVSTSEQKFISVDNNEIQESESKFYFIGQERENDVRDNILENLPSTYDLDQDTLVRKLVSNFSEVLLRARSNIREVANANFLSESVSDELKIRGYHPNDRLNNEGAYEVSRVSKNPEGAQEIRIINFVEKNSSDILGEDDKIKANTSITGFPPDPFSLRSEEVRKEIVSNTENALNKFDGTTITLEKSNIVFLSGLKLIKSDGYEYVYDIPKYGYSLLNNRYDSRYARKLLTLQSNQIRLSDLSILNGDFVVPVGSDKLEVSYFYIDGGINILSSDIIVSKIKESIREVVGPLLTIFSLKNYPIVLSNDTIPLQGAISFLDPNPPIGTPFSKVHPAFRAEIPFDRTRLPSSNGEYSVDYTTGQVFVFGAITNDGTGTYPPVASYFYRKTFQNGVDYNFNSEFDEIVAVPSRDLVGENVKLNFTIEKVLAEGVDWINETHIEIKNEYVENRWYNQFQLATQHIPITNVFEVLNETTGEKYSITRYDDNYIYLNGRNLPRFVSTQNEQLSLAIASNETLLVNEELSHTGGTKIFRATLQHKGVVSNVGQKGASNTNSSIVFSNDSIFRNEFYFDAIEQTLAQNLLKLSTVGDYVVDYGNGDIYVLVSTTHSYDLGAASYAYSEARTVFSQLLSVDEVAYKKNVKSTPTTTVLAKSFTSDSIKLNDLPEAVERFYNKNPATPILLGTVQQGLIGQMTPLSFEFIAGDGNFEPHFADGYHILRIVGEPDRTITSISSNKSLIVDIAFTEFSKTSPWYIIDFNLSDGYTVITSSNIDYVNGVYKISDLQTVSKSNLTNYFDPNIDKIIGNEIIFNNNLIKNLPSGTALAIDYTYGSLYGTYTYVKDVVRISYEYGDNSINFGQGSALNPEDQYFVSYRYGALREKLLQNFGSLTNIDDLIAFPTDFDRETYRNFLIGTLQAFVNGPTNTSIKKLIQSITGIEPSIRELTFNEWTAGRDNLYLQDGKFTGKEIYKEGRFGDGLYFGKGNSLSYPEESYVSYRDGTFEAWTIPDWAGIDNDAQLTINTSLPLNKIFVGASAFSPKTMPFKVSRFDLDPVSVLGRPVNYAESPGAFLWLDEETKKWNFDIATDGYGRIETTGEMHNAFGNIRTSTNFIEFDGYGDGYDGIFDGYDGYAIRTKISFQSDDVHYLMDAGAAHNHNRISIFKDGSGFLNFRVYDDAGRERPLLSKFYNISKDISDWVPGVRHFIGAAWRLNTSEGIDEMHMFVDGLEVPNVLKFGGRPQSNVGSSFRDVAIERLTSSSAKNIVGASDGKTTAGSAVISSATAGFVDHGIVVGDSLTILDSTADGMGSPYTIVGVGQLSVSLSAPLMLSLNNVKFSVNRAAYQVKSNVDVEDFIVETVDGYGKKKELHGLGAEEPDYSISRSGGSNTIHINSGVKAGDKIDIKTLGLTTARNRELYHLYQDGYNIIQTRGAPPASLNHFEAYKIMARKTEIASDGYELGTDGYFAFSGNQINGYFIGFPQPSNSTNGKSITVILGGTNNINFSGINEVIVYGTTYAGPTHETLNFSNYGAKSTINYFRSISGIFMSFASYDNTKAVGSIEIIETTPFTEMENNGDYAQISGYNNGVISFIVFGSGDVIWPLEGNCYYLLDYPISLNIPMKQKGKLYLGSSMDGRKEWKGTIDQASFLNEMLSDIRPGEVNNNLRNITRDFNSPLPLDVSPQTLMLLNFDRKIQNVQKFFKNFDEKFITSSSSVNPAFGDSVIFIKDSAYKVDNGSAVFNNDEGTVEFWVSPLLDTLYDEKIDRYYIDVSSTRVEKIISNTALTISLPSKARRVASIRLIGDSGIGTDFFSGGELLVDGKTIILGSRLPGAQTLVEVKYVPIDFNGDRVSIFKDSDGFINFSIIAGDQLYMISYPITWRRDSWHRVKATWKTNSINNKDAMRLFVDGVESGTITWGTPGLIYGNGIVYGQALVGDAGANTLVANIDLTDTFADIHIGNSFDLKNSAAAKMDNVRFSNQIREPSLVSTNALDLNYNSNLGAVIPVIYDNITTLLLDFDRSIEESEFLANLLSKYTPLFQLDVEIDDSFKKIPDSRYRALLERILERLKPAHSRLYVKYADE